MAGARPACYCSRLARVWLGCNTMTNVALFGALLAAWLTQSAAHAQDQNCGHPYDSPGHFGPFDYTDRSLGEERSLVERGHFTSFIEEMALYGFASRKAN